MTAILVIIGLCTVLVVILIGIPYAVFAIITWLINRKTRALRAKRNASEK